MMFSDIINKVKKVAKNLTNFFGNNKVFRLRSKVFAVFPRVFSFFIQFIKDKDSSKKRLFLRFVEFLNQKNESTVIDYDSREKKVNGNEKESVDVRAGRFFSIDEVLKNHRSDSKNERMRVPNDENNNGFILFYRILYIIVISFTCIVVVFFILFMCEPFIVEWLYPDMVVHQVRSKFGKDFISLWSGPLYDIDYFAQFWTAGHWLFSGMFFFKRRRFLRKFRFHYWRRRKGYYKLKKFMYPRVFKDSLRKGIGDYRWLFKRRPKRLKFRFMKFRSPTKRFVRFKTFLYNYGLWARKFKKRLKLERIYNTFHIYTEGIIHIKFFRKQKYYPMRFKVPDNAGYHRACYDNHFQKVLGFPPTFTTPVMKRFLYRYYKFARWFRVNREYWGDAIFVMKKAANPPANDPKGIPYRNDFLKMIRFFAPAYNIFYDIFIQPLDNIIKKRFPAYEEDYEDVLDEIQEGAVLSLLIEGTELVFHRNLYRWVYIWIWFYLNYMIILNLIYFYRELVDQEVDYNSMDFFELCLTVLLIYNILLCVFYFNYFDDSQHRELFMP